jgi:hypothetical protein
LSGRNISSPRAYMTGRAPSLQHSSERVMYIGPERRLIIHSDHRVPRLIRHIAFEERPQRRLRLGQAPERLVTEPELCLRHLAPRVGGDFQVGDRLLMPLEREQRIARQCSRALVPRIDRKGVARPVQALIPDASMRGRASKAPRSIRGPRVSVPRAPIRSFRPADVAVAKEVVTFGNQTRDPRGPSSHCRLASRDHQRWSRAANNVARAAAGPFGLTWSDQMIKYATDHPPHLSA